MRKLVLLTIIVLAFAACQTPEANTPALTGTVSISGTAETGQTLTANTSNLAGSSSEAITYQWKRGDTNIGTNSSTYIVQTADEGSTITVTVTRAGYSGTVTSVAFGPIAISAAFNSVTANGSETETTRDLTLTFSRAITGLTAADITLNGVSGVNKGTLTGSGPTYTLPISGFTESGTLTVSVTKSGYNISNSSKTVGIHHYTYTPPPDSVSTGIVIELADIDIDEWELIEQTAQAAPNTDKTFTVTETYESYQWYLDGKPVGTSSNTYTLNKPAGVYQLVVVVTNSNGESRSGRCRVTVRQ